MRKTNRKNASKNDTTKTSSGYSSNHTSKVCNFFKKNKTKTIIVGASLLTIIIVIALVPIISNSSQTENESDRDYWVKLDKESIEADCQVKIEQGGVYCVANEKLTGTYSAYDKIEFYASNSHDMIKDGEKFELTIKKYLYARTSIPEEIDSEIAYTETFYMRDHTKGGRNVYDKGISVKFHISDEAKKLIKEEKIKADTEEEQKASEEEKKKADEEEKKKADEEEQQKTSNNTEQQTSEEKPKEETKPAETTTTITGKDHDENDMAGKFNGITNACLDRVDVHYPGAYPLDSDDGYPIYYSITVKNNGTLVEGAMNGYIRTKYGQKILSYHCVYKDGAAKIKELE